MLTMCIMVSPHRETLLQTEPHKDIHHRTSKQMRNPEFCTLTMSLAEMSQSMNSKPKTLGYKMEDK